MAESVVSIKALDFANLPEETSAEYQTWIDQAFNEASQILNSLEEPKEWPMTKSFHEGTVNTKSRRPKTGEKFGWSARISFHDIPYEKFKEGLMIEHAEKEKEYIGDLKKVELVKALKAGEAEVWHNYYKFPFPTSNRDFVVLILTKETSTEPEARSFTVISIPVQYQKTRGYVRASYVSVDCTTEMKKDGKVQLQWRMATASDAAGNIPRRVTEYVLPMKISEDVPSFTKWVKSR